MNGRTRLPASILMPRSRKYAGASEVFIVRFVIATAWSIAVFAPVNANDVAVQKLLTGLNAPTGVAIRPDSGDEPCEVFVADRGTGRIIKLVSNAPDSRVDIITGFPARAANDNSATSPGIQSLFFLDHTRLVVAGAGDGGTPFLKLYELSDPVKPIKAEEHKQVVELPGVTGRPAEDRRAFHDLARTRSNDRVADLLLAAATDENGAGSLWRVYVRANTLGEIGAFEIGNGENGESINGVAVTNSGYIVIADGPVKAADQAAELKFVNPSNGQLALQIKSGLHRIAGLAYSPKSDSLYAVGATAAGDSGGVYRIDDASAPGKPACKATKIADAARPTALAVGPDGSLYVTTLGESNEKGDKGTLLKLTGDL